MFDTGKDVSNYYEKWPVLVLMVWPSETDVITQAIITLDGLVLWHMSDSGWSVVLFCLHCWLSEVLVLGFEKSSWTTLCSGGDGRWPSVWGSSQHGSWICCSSPPQNGGCFAGSLLQAQSSPSPASSDNTSLTQIGRVGPFKWLCWVWCAVICFSLFNDTIVTSHHTSPYM